MVNTSKIKAHPKPQESCDAKKRPANFIEFTGIMTTNFLTEQKYPCIEEISGGNSGGGSGGGSSGGGSSGGGFGGGGGGSW